MRANRPEKDEPAEPDPTGTEPFRVAMDELRSAVEHRHVEPICAAYLRLRQAAEGLPARDLIRRIERDAGAGVPEMIVSGFSHRRCLMCSSGVIVCETCEGSGRLGKSVCPQCDGLCVEPCPFCQGLCWPDANEIPRELAGLVDARRRSHLDKDLARLAKTPPPERLAESLNGQRVGVAKWLLRLRARLVSLTVGRDDADARRRQELLRRIDALLEVLRSPQGNGGPPSGKTA